MPLEIFSVKSNFRGYLGKKDIDGVLGKKTYGAVKAYQKRHRLATGGLTYETIENLGVTI